MAGADTSLLAVIVGGLLTGAFALGGIWVGQFAASRREAAQQRREDRKRRADKFEELVAAVYEYEHWVDGIRQREVLGTNIPETVSPFAKVQAISAVYFPQFDEQIRGVEKATIQFRLWMQKAASKRIAGDSTNLTEGFAGAYQPYWEKLGGLINSLTKFAHEEFR